MRTKRWILCGLAVTLAIASVATASDKPRIAVIEFENKANVSYWSTNGGRAAQDILVTELVKSGRFRVIERERLQSLLSEQNLSLSGSADAATAARAGKLLGVQYMLTGAVTEYGATETSAHARRVGRVRGMAGAKRKFVAALNARIIDTETGEIVWADEARGEDAKFKVSIGGFGGGTDRDSRMFDRVLKPMLGELVASIKAADL